MTVNEALRAGFSLANTRIGDVVLDVLWKGIWLVITALLLVLLSVWFYSEFQSIGIDNPAALNNPLAVTVLMRHIWDAYAGTVFWMVTGVGVLSSVTWIFLEAWFRAGIFAGSAAKHFPRFLAASAAKLIALASVIGLFGVILFRRYLVTPYPEWQTLWTETRGPFYLMLLISVVIWFALTIVETLIRGNALDLLGRDFLLVIGTMATLCTFEGLLAVSFMMGLLALSMLLPGVEGLMLLSGIAVLCLGVFNILHSYLLVVRFSFIAAADPSDFI